MTICTTVLEQTQENKNSFRCGKVLLAVMAAISFVVAAQLAWLTSTDLLYVFVLVMVAMSLTLLTSELKWSKKSSIAVVLNLAALLLLLNKLLFSVTYIPVQ